MAAPTTRVTTSESKIPTSDVTSQPPSRILPYDMVISATVLRWEQGAEWMIGRTATVIDLLPDEDMWGDCIVHIIDPVGRIINLRFPHFVLVDKGVDVWKDA